MRQKFQPVGAPRPWFVDRRVVHISEHGIYSHSVGVLQIHQFNKIRQIDWHFGYDYNTAINDSGMTPVALIAGCLWHIGGKPIPARTPMTSRMDRIDYSPIRGYIAYSAKNIASLGDLDTYVPVYNTHAQLTNVFMSHISANMYVTYRTSTSDTIITVIDEHNISRNLSIYGFDARCRYLFPPDSPDIITCIGIVGIYQLDLWRADSHPMKRMCEHSYVFNHVHFDRNTLVSADSQSMYITDLRCGKEHKISRNVRGSPPDVWCVASHRSVYLANDGPVWQYI